MTLYLLPIFSFVIVENPVYYVGGICKFINGATAEFSYTIVNVEAVGGG